MRGLKRGGGGGGGGKQTGKKFDILKTKTTWTAICEEQSTRGQSIPSQLLPSAPALTVCSKKRKQSVEPNQRYLDNSGSWRRTSSRTLEQQEASIPTYHHCTDKHARIRGSSKHGRGVSTSSGGPAFEGDTRFRRRRRKVVRARPRREREEKVRLRRLIEAAANWRTNSKRSTSPRSTVWVAPSLKSVWNTLSSLYRWSKNPGDIWDHWVVAATLF